MAKLIILNRKNEFEIKPGYDGVYGELILKEEYKIKKQKSLGEF